MVWKAIKLYFNILQKMANLQKSKYLMRNQIIRQKMRNKKLGKLQQIIHFWNVQEHV